MGGNRWFHVASKPFVMAGVDSGLVSIIVVIIIAINAIVVINVIIVISGGRPFSASEKDHPVTLLLNHHLHISKVVVFAIIVFMIAVMLTSLIYVKYEWCHVLFKNNTVCCTFLLRNTKNTKLKAYFVKNNTIHFVAESWTMKTIVM